MSIDKSQTMLCSMRKEQALEGAYPVKATLKNGKTVTVRPLSVKDGEKLAHFYEQIPEEDYFFYCPNALDRENALKKAANADAANFVCLVIETEQSEIAGYAWYRWGNSFDKSEFGICIRRDHHGIGAGKIIMTKLMQTAEIYGPPVMSLTVQKANEGAVKLYPKLGFKIIREQLRGGDNEPEYYMENVVG
jgi:ribosomal protein S18 acetylase RimI-like enzyme